MKSGPKNIPASIRARLASLAKKTDRDFQEVLLLYAIERFLYRLSHSPHSPKFLLKGALLFATTGQGSYRPTRDIDLEGFTSNDVATLVGIMQEVCRQPVEPDGMDYKADSMQGESTQDEADYDGVRLKFWGQLGNARLPMQVDIGFADKITPAPVTVYYSSLLGLPAPQLRGYPYETVIAEKLQILVRLGQINTRLKDFYDLQHLARQQAFVGNVLRQAIVATFGHRSTPLPHAVPTALTGEFAAAKQVEWRAFLQRSRLGEHSPANFGEVVDEIRAFLWPVLDAAARGTAFELNWAPGGPWG